MKFTILSQLTLAVSSLTMVVNAADNVNAADDASSTSTIEGTPALRGSGGDSGAQRELTSPVLATFYEHFDFYGRSITATHLGYYGIDFLYKAHFNDIVSSVKVAPGYAVKLCYDDGCYNPSDFVTAGSVSRFGHFNDKLSSFIIYQPAAVLYEHGHYDGRGLVALEPGHYDIDFFYHNHFNDLASSMIVTHGYQVFLCRHGSFVECEHEPVVGNIPWFGHLNDQVSSIKVIRVSLY